MKAFKILTTVVSLVLLLNYAGCKSSGGTAESTQDKQLGLLSGTWKVSTVTKDGTDVTTSTTLGPWTSFQLTMSGTKGATSFTYSCATRPAPTSPWPASGTWAFGTDPVTQIIRDKGAAGSSTAGAELAMTYLVGTDKNGVATTLQISFSFAGAGYTRVSNLGGAWVFNFTK